MWVWSAATRSHFPAIDVNQPSALAPEVEVSSPNSTLSSVSGKRSERGEDDAGAGIRAGDEDESAGGEAGRKKLRLTREEATVLEKAFEENSTLNR
ncbi:unnamed protein product [Thlaspi arvense]|uniref:HD-ZIP protein N-terminal domain-containing protein n=1 Tax=Thlaspi arvense TaxID=13288 RepID=A0AAU9RHB8_THLAR|nr:unnamed protein product [Thlaspi arvense]